MSYYSIEKLRNGDVDFLYDFLPHDEKKCQESIRTLPDRLAVVQSFYEKAKTIAPFFCFEIIYDMDEYKKETFDLIKKYNCKFSTEKLINILNNTSWGENYVFKNIDKIIAEDKNRIPMILDFVFNKAKRYNDWITLFKTHTNLHYRFLFIQYIIENHPNELNNIYNNDLIKFTTSHTGLPYEQLTLLSEKMNSKDISKIAYALFDSKIDKKFYLELKEYILNNYLENDIAELLLELKQVPSGNPGACRLVQNETGINEFQSDAQRLYLTSRNYQFHIMKKFSDYLSEKLVEEFEYYNKLFSETPKRRRDEPMRRIDCYGLTKEVKRSVDTYLDLSENKTYEYINSGSTSDCYRIGDYIFKLIRSKWSYEDIISPNLYLIIKNYEEFYIRDKDGFVSCGLEVQKFLKKPVREIDNLSDRISWLNITLQSLGYYYADRYLSEEWGDNIGILDSYKDADCKNHEALPAEFKQTPLVIIDRDRIFKVNDKHPKLIKENWY